MAEKKEEREVKKGNLELSCDLVVRYDVVETESSEEGGEKLGEVDVYMYSLNSTEGFIFLKEVYDIKGALKRTYFSSDEEINSAEEAATQLRNLFDNKEVYLDGARSL